MVGKWHRMLLFICLGTISGLSAQEIKEKFPVLLWPPGSPGNARNILRAHAIQELEYSISVSASHFQNKSGNDFVISFQSLKYKFSLAFPGAIILSGKIHHELGFRFFSDSTTVISPDETIISARILATLIKNCKLDFSSDVSTRIFNKSEAVADVNGNLHIQKTSSFMNPLIADLSIGLSYIQSGFGEIKLGTSSARFTLITDSGIFGRIGAGQFYGIPEGKKHLFEYGLSLQLQIDKELLKKLHWKCDLKIFKNYLSPADLSLNNIFSYNLNRFISVTFRTFISYERAVSKKIQMENHINIGFSLQL